MEAQGGKLLFKVIGSFLGLWKAKVAEGPSSQGNHRYYKWPTLTIQTNVHSTQGDLPKVTWPGNCT